LFPYQHVESFASMFGVTLLKTNVAAKVVLGRQAFPFIDL